MMGIFRTLVCLPALALICTLGPSERAEAQTIAATERQRAAPARQASRPNNTPHVYLFRGLLNIFSLGMDDLGAKIQARGYSASVHNHAEWQTIADNIIAGRKAGDRGAIVLIGHSLGADAVMFMSEYLGKHKVPVALVVPFDGTGSFAASANVARVMNLTQRDYAHMRRGPGFRGELKNIDVSGQPGIDHINIDKSARLHDMVLGRLPGVIGRGNTRSQAISDRGPPAPRARPASASPADEPKSTPAAVTPAATTPAATTPASEPPATGTIPPAAKPAAVAPADKPATTAADKPAPAEKPAAAPAAPKAAPETTASTTSGVSSEREEATSRRSAAPSESSASRASAPGREAKQKQKPKPELRF